MPGQPLDPHTREFFCLDEAEPDPRDSTIIMGLDLGKQQDYSALGVIEAFSEGLECHLRHMERFKLGTSYPSIVRSVRDLLRAPELAEATLVVDATGVGRPVVDLMIDQGMTPIPITITGGDSVSQDKDGWHVPKRDLIMTMQVLLQNGRFRVASGLPLAETLARELQNFKVKLTKAAHDTYEASREGEHDDLVLAVSLACWWARHGPRPRIRFL